MPVEETITCSMCPAVRGPSNHWLQADDGNRGGAIQFSVWGPEYRDAAYHLCGSACAGKLLEQTIQKWRGQ